MNSVLLEAFHSLSTQRLLWYADSIYLYESPDALRNSQINSDNSRCYNSWNVQ